jgi:CHAD domain-containing protein
MVLYAAAQVQRRLRKLASQLRRAAKRPHEPDEIHVLRVSSRRFMQSLKVFGQFFDRQTTKKMRRRLRRLMDLSGEARNCDITLELLELAGVDVGKSASQLRRRRKRAEEILIEMLCRWRKRKLHDQWLHQISVIEGVSGDWDGARSVESNARQGLPNLAREFFAAGAVAARMNSNHEQLHQFRLRAKRFRYTLELFQPVFGPEMTRGVNALRGLQDRLGSINDCVTALNLISVNPSAAVAIEKLLVERETALRTYWRHHFSFHHQAWWLDWLSRSTEKQPARKAMASEAPLPSARKGRAA